MTPVRQHRTVADLAPLARAALGRHRTLAAVTRLRGGSKKGVYRLHLDDSRTAVAYVWSPDEDYWDQPDADPRDPFSHASGLGLFTASHDRLAAVGVRTPRLLHVDEAAGAAVVEDLSGGSLEEALRRDPEAAGPALRQLAEALRLLRDCRSAGHGKVALVDCGGTAYGDSCARLVTERALSDIAETALRDPRAAAARARLEEGVRSLAGAVRPRAGHGLVHGELGPDHVLLDDAGRPALIDIEGLMYFDPEWEHVFLRLRFGPHYAGLRAPGLDEDRLRLYRLAMHLNLVAGPLRLLDGDFPRPEFMRGIAEYNLGQALSLTGCAS
ncbi:aminoglycoside phosphotransferase family protein [Streptomyces sp. Caat 7-52]|uniref:aminoglycoside phosphotransferase family protein n=1 Tax=Streptomyces sp. Caat 7-52 TaxID=2949637 RepID=UPI00203634D7|nr:aminoglycoside phosphotransferase family protein [Streptomyces sp. Caat 7-52]